MQSSYLGTQAVEVSPSGASGAGQQNWWSTVWLLCGEEQTQNNRVNIHLFVYLFFSLPSWPFAEPAPAPNRWSQLSGCTQQLSSSGRLHVFVRGAEARHYKGSGRLFFLFSYPLKNTQKQQDKAVKNGLNCVCLLANISPKEVFPSAREFWWTFPFDWPSPIFTYLNLDFVS